MNDQELVEQLFKCAQKSTDQSQDECLAKMKTLIQTHREQYAEKKFSEGLTEFENGIITKMESHQKECASNPKKELYSQFLKLNIEYWKTNPFPKPLINHDN